MIVVNGEPAIAFYDPTNGNLRYIRATDATGSTLGAPVTLGSGGTVGQFLSMIMVNGAPAVSYHDGTSVEAGSIMRLR